MDFLAWVAKWIIVGGAVCLTVSPFFVTPETLLTVGFLRVIIVRSVIEIMVLAYLCLCLFLKGARGYRPQHSWIAWAVGGFLCAFLLSTLFGINPYRSFWGSHVRMEGYVTLLHFGALFLVLYGTLRTPEEYKKILWASILISVAQCFYAFGQLPAIDIRATQLYSRDTTRISGTFGNPTFFALYLIFQIFFAMMLFLWEKQTWRRAVLVGVCLINGVAIFLSGTRGAMLGMYVGIGLMGLGHVLVSGTRKLRLGGLVTLVLVAALLGTLYTFRDSQFVQDRFILQRATIFAAGDSAIISRLMAWKIILTGWQDRFWFGYGMENLNYVFNHYYNPRMLVYADDFYESHNRFVDSLVTGGFFGVVTHLSVFATAGWFLLKQWWPNRGYMVPLAGLALLVAYFVQLCTLFDHIISYQYFAIFLALLATWEVQSARPAPQTPQKLRALVPPWDMAGAPYKIGIVVLAVVGMMRFMWYTNIVPAEASQGVYIATKIYYASQGREFHKAFAALQHALALNTYLNVDLRLTPLRLHFSEFAATRGQTTKTQAKQQFSRQTLEYLADQFSHSLHDHHPDIKDLVSHTVYGHIAQALADYDPAWTEKALESYRQGLQEYPKSWRLIALLACAYLEMGRMEDALQVYEGHPLEVAEGVFFFNYAAALYSVGRNEDAWKQIEQALAFKYDFTRNMPQLVAVLAKEKRYDRIARLYEYQLQNYQKNHTQLMASLVQTYKEMEDSQNAQRATAKLPDVAPPSQQDTRAFLKSPAATATTATAIAPQCH